MNHYTSIRIWDQKLNMNHLLGNGDGLDFMHFGATRNQVLNDDLSKSTMTSGSASRLEGRGLRLGENLTEWCAGIRVK